MLVPSYLNNVLHLKFLILYVSLIIAENYRQERFQF